MLGQSAIHQVPTGFSLPLRLWEHLHVPPLFTPAGGGAPQAPPRPADGTFLSKELVTAPLAPVVRPVPFAVARRQPRGEVTVPPAAPRPGAAPCPLTLVAGQCQPRAASLRPESSALPVARSGRPVAPPWPLRACWASPACALPGCAPSG